MYNSVATKREEEENAYEIQQFDNVPGRPEFEDRQASQNKTLHITGGYGREDYCIDDRYFVETVLGTGGFGSTLKCLREKDGKYYAVKVVA